MVNIDSSKFSLSTTTYQGSDSDLISHLTNLWADNISKLGRIRYTGTNYPNSRNKQLSQFKNKLSQLSNKLVFRGNFGAYNEKLEKELSLTKKQVKMNKSDTQLLHNCLTDLFIYNNIRGKWFDKIKYTTLFVKHKKGDPKDPKNFRYLSNHSKIFKIIDKLWTDLLIGVLKKENKLPDKKIVRNHFYRTFETSIRDLAIEKLVKYHSNKNILLLDISKAFDNVSWKVIKSLLFKSLSRKINKKFAHKMTKQYLFLISNRVIKYKNKKINFYKSLATGLPSSTIVFSLLMEQIIYEWNISHEFSKEVIINTYVDDIFIEFLKTINCQKITNSLIKQFEKYNFIINKEKTKTNCQLLNYSKINSFDCYLGMPFAKDKNTYIKVCLDLFQKKYYSITTKEIIKFLLIEKYDKVKNQITGFFNYKLYGLKVFEEKEINLLNIFLNYNRQIQT